MKHTMRRIVIRLTALALVVTMLGFSAVDAWAYKNQWSGNPDNHNPQDDTKNNKDFSDSGGQDSPGGVELIKCTDAITDGGGTTPGHKNSGATDNRSSPNCDHFFQQ